MSETDQEFCVDQELDTNALKPLRAWVDDLLAGGSRPSSRAGDASIEGAQRFLGAYLLEDERLVQLVDELEESLVAVGSTADLSWVPASVDQLIMWPCSNWLGPPQPVYSACLLAPRAGARRGGDAAPAAQPRERPEKAPGGRSGGLTAWADGRTVGWPPEWV